MRTVLLALALAAQASVASAQSIKLASVVPENSIWDKNLKQMGAEWSQATGGRVNVTVYAGGSQGDEPTVLRKMRLDALQAASFTAVGLGTIDAAFNSSYDSKKNGTVNRLNDGSMPASPPPVNAAACSASSRILRSVVASSPCVAPAYTVSVTRPPVACDHSAAIC